jgi:hypothetical protein
MSRRRKTAIRISYLILMLFAKHFGDDKDEHRATQSAAEKQIQNRITNRSQRYDVRQYCIHGSSLSFIENFKSLIRLDPFVSPLLISKSTFRLHFEISAKHSAKVVPADISLEMSIHAAPPRHICRSPPNWHT